jgi:hypothetical protein
MRGRKLFLDARGEKNATNNDERILQHPKVLRDPVASDCKDLFEKKPAPKRKNLLGWD